MSSLARTFSVGLRMASLVAKFALIFFVARFLTPTEFGIYGLFVAGVGYLTYIVGADFYTFSNRELIRADLGHQGSILKCQAAAYGLTYATVVPLVVLAFSYDFLPWSLLGGFLIILVVEHVGQESNRLLVALGHPAASALVLFLRAGLWPLGVILLLWWKPAFRSLPVVFACWAASGALGLAVAIVLLRRKRLSGWVEPVDWSWVRRGFRVAGWFLMASLALRGLFAVDRFWVDLLAVPETLGAYVFFMSIAGALPALLEAGLFAFEYPAMIATYPKLRPFDQRLHVRRLLVQVGVISIMYCAVVAVFLPLALKLVSRPEYAEHLFFLISGMAAMILYVLSLVPHFALYATGKDRAIIVGNVLAFIAFFPATLALRHLLSTEDAIPAGLCVSFLFLLVWKALAFHRSTLFQPKNMAVI